MTQYLLSIYQPDGEPPPPEVLEQVMRDAGRAEPGAQGRRRVGLRRRPARPEHGHRRARAATATCSITDGPFAEGKEHLGGFWIIKAPDLDAALEWARKAGARRPRCRSRCGRSRTVRVLTSVATPTPSEIERVFRAEYGRAVAVLVRVFGDIDVAEEAVQDAFTAARAALAGRRPAAEPGRLDHHHRPQPGDRPAAPRGVPRRPARAGRAAARQRATSPTEEGAVRDDRLRLIFTCCHPALGRRARRSR